MNQKSVKVVTGCLLAVSLVTVATYQLTPKIPELAIPTTIAYKPLPRLQLDVELDKLPSRHITETFAPSPTPTPTPSPTPSPTRKVSSKESEKELFIKIVAAEAGHNWDIEGYWLIAQTVVNQLHNGYWGNSLRDVLTYKGNYSVYASGWYNQQPDSKLDKARKAVEMVLAGQSPQNLHISVATAETILYFCTTSHLNSHPNGFHATRCTKVTVYDNVTFFK